MLGNHWTNLSQNSTAHGAGSLFIADSVTPDRSLGAGACEIIGCDIPVLGEMVHINIGATSGEVRLADIVPVARWICDTVTRKVVDRAVAEKCDIPCGEGCSGCCKRFLVPVTVCEAFALTEQVLNAEPGESRKMQRGLLLAARRIMQHQPPRLSFDGSNPDPCSEDNLLATSQWYEKLDVSCPFLINDCCSIYETRPFACREHYVQGSARGCAGGREHAEALYVPVRMANVLGLVAAELESGEVEAIPLTLMLAWCEINAERAHRTWPAVYVAQVLARTVRQIATQGAREVLSIY